MLFGTIVSQVGARKDAKRGRAIALTREGDGGDRLQHPIQINMMAGMPIQYKGACVCVRACASTHLAARLGVGHEVTHVRDREQLDLGGRLDRAHAPAARVCLQSCA